MDCVAIGWLVWVTWLVGDVGIQSVHEVFAVGWQLWGTVLIGVLQYWVGAAGWLLCETGVGGWVLWVEVVGVGRGLLFSWVVAVGGLVSGLFVGVGLGWVLSRWVTVGGWVVRRMGGWGGKGGLA